MKKDKKNIIEAKQWLMRWYVGMIPAEVLEIEFERLGLIKDEIIEQEK